MKYEDLQVGTKFYMKSSILVKDKHLLWEITEITKYQINNRIKEYKTAKCLQTNEIRYLDKDNEWLYKGGNLKPCQF